MGTSNQNLRDYTNFIVLNLGLLYINGKSSLKSFEGFKNFLSTRISEIVLRNNSFDINIACVLNYFGFLLFKQRNYREATEWFQQCIDLVSSFPQKNEEFLNGVSQNLSSSYFFLQEYSKALPLLNQAIQVRRRMANTNE